MVINSTNINKTNNHLSSQTIEHTKKTHDIWRSKYKSSYDRHTNVTEFNLLMGSPPISIWYWDPQQQDRYKQARANETRTNSIPLKSVHTLS